MMRRLLLATLLLALPIVVSAYSSSNYTVTAPTIAPGKYATSTDYALYSTIGEIAHSPGSSAHFSLNLGFFSYPFVTTPVLSAQVGNVDQRVDLSWSAAVPYLGYTVSGYQVGKATVSGGPYTYTAVGNVLTSNVTGLSDGTTYYFVVRAMDNSSIPIATSSQVSAVPVAPSLTFTVDSGSQTFPSLTPGTLVATSSILQVKTNNGTGYTVSLARSAAAATLALNTDSSYHITDKTDWLAPGATTTNSNTTASTTQPLTLQFRLWKAMTDNQNYSGSWWGSDDSAAGALFAGIPSTTQTIANSSVPANATTTARVLYDLNVPITQKNGAYSGSIVYSVTANP